MSRTIRRKNYEAEQRSSWDNQGGKIAGYYTKRDFNWLNGSSWYTYSVPTEAEYHEQYWNIHGDNHDYHSKPSKWYRFFTIHQYRMLDKTELRKFMKGADYEPMCWNRISEGYWD